MIILDAFYLSHTYEPVDVPGQEEVDQFLPPFAPKFQLDTAHPCGFGPLVAPGDYMEMRYHIAMAMEEALGRFDESKRHLPHILTAAMVRWKRLIARTPTLSLSPRGQ